MTSKIDKGEGSYGYPPIVPISPWKYHTEQTIQSVVVTITQTDLDDKTPAQSRPTCPTCVLNSAFLTRTTFLGKQAFILHRSWVLLEDFFKYPTIF